MSQIVIQCVERYIAEQTKDPVLMRALRNQEITNQTGLVQNADKTWVKPETLTTEEDEWRHLLL